MPNRYDLDAEMAESRKPIDASWSPRKKKIVGVSCAVVAVGVLAAGAWIATANAAPPLPKTAAEAVAVMNSDKFANLDPARKRQYATEASRLIRDLSEDERRSLLRDEKNRDAMRKLWEEMFDDMARKIARGEQVDRPGPPRGQRPAGDRPPREELTPEQRAQRQEERRQEMNKRFTEALASGNSQSGALRAEMMKKFFSQGGGRGGGGPRGGGGGGRGGGGRGG